ncbi:MAG: hypothetical protein ACSHYA_05950 [Opitutaceae bacterium]
MSFPLLAEDPSVPVELRIYSLFPQHELSISSATSETQTVELFSTRLSSEIEVTPPVTINDTETGKTIHWAPEEGTEFTEWVLFIDSRTKKQSEIQVSAIPARDLPTQKGNLSIINMTGLELGGKINGNEFQTASQGLSVQPIKSPNLSINLSSMNSPHYCKTNQNEMDTDGRYLFILAAPFTVNSATLMYRIARLTDPETLETTPDKI